jgi:drug/metabolite transporter (DMT)-like permease
VLGGLFTYAFYSALLSKRPPIHAMSFVAVTFGLGTLMLLPFCALELARGAAIQVSWASLLAIFYVAIFPSLIAFICFNRGVELIGPNRAGVFFHLMPPIGAGLAMLVLGERPALFHAVGLTLILCGVALAAAPRRALWERKADP